MRDRTRGNSGVRLQQGGWSMRRVLALGNVAGHRLAPRAAPCVDAQEDTERRRRRPVPSRVRLPSEPQFTLQDLLPPTMRRRFKAPNSRSRRSTSEGECWAATCA